MNQPPPEVLKGIEEIKLKHSDQQIKREAMQMKGQADAAKLQLDQAKLQQDGQLGQAKLQIEASKPATGLAPPEDKSQELALKAAEVASSAKDVQFKQERALKEDENRDLERQAQLQEANLRLVGDLMKTKASQSHATTEREAQHAHEKEIARMKPKAKSDG
jgi:phosphatidate phosphatase PAH1